MKINKKAILYFLLSLVVETGIALFVHDTFVRPYIGDVLVVAVVYWFLRIFMRPHRLLPLWVFVFAAVVECSQYFDLVSLLNMANNRIFATIFGATFDWLDLLCYGVGCGLVYLINEAKVAPRLCGMTERDKSANR